MQGMSDIMALYAEGASSLCVNGSVDMLGRLAGISASKYTGYPPYDDAPKEGEFDWEGFTRNLAIGLGVVAVCAIGAAISIATLGAGSILAGAFIGVGIGALIHNWIPEVWVESILGSNNPFGVILATLIGIPMYADIFGTIPIAEALLAKGAQLGTILSFMMAVTTLSLPSLIMLRKAIKPKLLGIFIAICAIGIIVVGYVFNTLQYFMI